MNQKTEAGSIQTGSDRMPKHLGVHQQVQRLDEVIGHLNDLITAIEGPMPETAGDPDAPKQPQPTFLDVINETADVINDKISTMHGRIEYLKTLLF